MNILIVDDSKLMRNILKSILNNMGYPDVYEATNGLEALTKVYEMSPDIVFMNLIMPEMDGYRASRKILREYPQTKIVVMSSNVEFAAPLKDSNIGFFDYIKVPFVENKIREVVKSASGLL